MACRREGMHAQLAGHAYAGVAASLARAAAGMWCERPLEVRLPELANRNVYGGDARNLR